jgi:hypothetical protein
VLSFNANSTCLAMHRCFHLSVLYCHPRFPCQRFHSAQSFFSDFTRYAPFCKHLFVPCFLPDAVVEAVAITPENQQLLRSDYEVYLALVAQQQRCGAYRALECMILHF